MRWKQRECVCFIKILYRIFSTEEGAGGMGRAGRRHSALGVVQVRTKLKLATFPKIELAQKFIA